MQPGHLVVAQVVDAARELHLKEVAGLFEGERIAGTCCALETNPVSHSLGVVVHVEVSKAGHGLQVRAGRGGRGRAHGRS